MLIGYGSCQSSQVVVLCWTTHSRGCLLLLDFRHSHLQLLHAKVCFVTTKTVLLDKMFDFVFMKGIYLWFRITSTPTCFLPNLPQPTLTPESFVSPHPLSYIYYRKTKLLLSKLLSSCVMQLFVWFEVDISKSAGFKDHNLYCVAPIMTPVMRYLNTTYSSNSLKLLNGSSNLLIDLFVCLFVHIVVEWNTGRLELTVVTLVPPSLATTLCTFFNKTYFFTK